MGKRNRHSDIAYAHLQVMRSSYINLSDLNHIPLRLRLHSGASSSGGSTTPEVSISPEARIVYVPQGAPSSGGPYSSPGAISSPDASTS